MAVEDGWRSALFEIGKKYRLLKNWSSSGISFQAGVIVEYESSGYEIYDNQSLFRFFEKEGLFSRKKELIWHLHDDEPETKTHEYFKEIR
jgi:hypothetical protein